MWGQYHPIPYRSNIKEKFLTVAGIGLDFKQALWWASGLFLSVQMSKVVPRIGEDWFYSRLHYGVPFLLCMILCYGRHAGTNLPLWRYGVKVLRLRSSRRYYLYKKAGD